MISIITAVHNQLAANTLFLESIRKYTQNRYELIVIDNASSDGSGDYFDKNGAMVIRNNYNYSYPYCQNQGIKAAQYSVLAFLNNDIVVSTNWDQRLIDSMGKNGLEVITGCGIENLESPAQTRRFKRKWKMIKYSLGLLGFNRISLKLMHKTMYGNWDKFVEKRYRKFKNQIKEGFVGNTVMMRRSVIERIGLWDERILGADFDLYLRTKKRHLDRGDVRPVHIALDVFNHHYIRLTLKSQYPRYKDADILIPLEEKWGPQELDRLPE